MTFLLLTFYEKKRFDYNNYLNTSYQFLPIDFLHTKITFLVTILIKLLKHIIFLDITKLKPNYNCFIK